MQELGVAEMPTHISDEGTGYQAECPEEGSHEVRVKTKVQWQTEIRDLMNVEPVMRSPWQWEEPPPQWRGHEGGSWQCHRPGLLTEVHVSPQFAPGGWDRTTRINACPTGFRFNTLYSHILFLCFRMKAPSLCHYMLKALNFLFCFYRRIWIRIYPETHRLCSQTRQ